MGEINELITKRAKAWEAAKAFLETHGGEDGRLSAEDDEQYTRMEAEVAEYTKAIDRLNRQAEIDAQLKAPTSAPLTGRPGAGNEPEGKKSSAYTKAMLDWMRSGFHVVSDVLSEGSDAEGGYLVPDEWDARLVDVLEEENVFRKKATILKTSGLHRINVAATKPAAAWIDEGGALTFGDATFGQVTLDAYKLYVAVKITEELLYDSAFPIDTYITQQFGKAIANAEEDAFLNGNGTGKPTGIFDATNGGTVVDAAGNKIASDDIFTLIYALKRPYRKNAEFIMNDATLAVIRKLKDANNQYIWQPSYQAGEPDRLAGYPVNTSAYAPKAEAGKAAIAFGDYKYYNIGDRGSRSFQELRELFAGNGMIGYVAKERVDGKLTLKEAVQILKLGA